MRDRVLIAALCLLLLGAGCADDGACDGGRCEQQCMPDCAGRQCGDDGCEGSCAPGCAAGEACTPAGQCEVDVDLGWGVTEICGVPANGGFGSFYTARQAVLVHGDSDEDAALAQKVYGWYGDRVADFQVRAASDLTEDERQRNLFVVGTPETNALIAEMNGDLPVYFDGAGFVFGGYRYDEHASGIALIHPSPFNASAKILLHAGNSLHGAFSTFTVMTGGHDYTTTRGRSTLQQEGELCREGEMWQFHPDYLATDLRKTWDEWLDGLEQTAGVHHVFHYPPSSRAAQDIGSLTGWIEQEYGDILRLLEVAALDLPIQTYLYPDNATKGQVTGSDGNAHANTLNFEAHSVYSASINALGAHEDAHLVSYHRIGDTSFALMGEGLAVWVDGEWWGESLQHWASQHKASGAIPALSELIDDFWSYDSGMTYPLAGHFFGFLVARHGVDAVKRLYVAENLRAGFTAALGQSASELESAWLASIP